MDATQKEAYYDEVIAPQLAKIARDCAARDMSFFAAVEYGPNDVGETRILAPGFGVTIPKLSQLLGIMPRKGE